MEQESPVHRRARLRGGCRVEGQGERVAGRMVGKDVPKRPSQGSPSYASPGDDILKEDLRIKLATGREFIAYII